MELDYKALREKADELARVEAAMRYPLGCKREKERKKLLDKYYKQYITPPQRLFA